VQILDSFGLPGLDNECGGLYKQRAPDLNLCLPPLAWQTYDIEFRAARFGAGRIGDPSAGKSSDASIKKIAGARITVMHNGVNRPQPCGADRQDRRRPARRPAAAADLLQDHGNPVRFRNIWIIER